MRGSVRGSGLGQSQSPPKLHDPEGATIIYFYAELTIFFVVFVAFKSSVLRIYIVWPTRGLITIAKTFQEG